MIDKEINTLNTILQRLHGLYELYLEELLDQRKAIVQNNLVLLKEHNEKIDLLVSKIHELENIRIRIMQRISESAGEEILNLSQLKSKSSDVKLHENLNQTGKNLKTLILQIAHENKVNSGLIESSRKLILTTMAIVTGVVGRDKKQNFTTYGKGGNTVRGDRQIRTLINTKG